MGYCCFLIIHNSPKVNLFPVIFFSVWFSQTYMQLNYILQCLIHLTDLLLKFSISFMQPSFSFLFYIQVLVFIIIFLNITDFIWFLHSFISSAQMLNIMSPYLVASITLRPHTKHQQHYFFCQTAKIVSIRLCVILQGCLVNPVCLRQPL